MENEEHKSQNSEKDVEMEEVEEVDQSEDLAPYSHQTLLMVRASQAQNGLRHNDYARYHHYCVRKVHRLRKTLKFT